MLQRTNGTTNDATMNECYNKQFLSIKSGFYSERMVQRTVFINKIRMLQRTNGTTKDATINECYNKQFLSIKSGRYSERMLQRTVFINKFRMLQRWQMLQRTRRYTIGRRSTRVRMTCRDFPLWLESQSSPLLLFVMFIYLFSSVICLFAPLAVKKKLNYSAIKFSHV